MDFSRMCPARWLSDPHDFMYPFYDMSLNYYRPWKWYNQSASKEFSSTVENEKGNYKITLDVQHFRPNEINVKVVDNEIIVEGKHEERPDTHGFIMRQFRRRYPLPSQYPSEYVTSTLSSDGILTIMAERISSKDVEKIVPIKMCGTCPRRTQTETKMTSEMSQKTQKENIKDTEDFMSRNSSQMTLKEEHSRLLKPELLKETISETNGTCTAKSATKEIIDIMKTSEKTEPFSIGSTTSKIEESIGKSILGLTALTEQLGQSSLASTSETCNMKNATEACSTKNASEMCGTKNASEMCGLKTASEMTAIKVPAEMCSMKSTSEICEMKGSLESGMKAMSKMSVEESSSTYKSSAMSSSTRMSGKIGETVSDIISAELREAAENV